jgi:hypothetical protein
MERFSGYRRVLFGRVSVGLLVAGLVLAAGAVAVMGGLVSLALMLLAVALVLLVVKVLLLRREQAAGPLASADPGGYFDLDIAVGSRRVFAAGGVPASLVGSALAQVARSSRSSGVPGRWDLETERALVGLMVKDTDGLAGADGDVTVHRCGDAVVALKRVARPRVPWTPASSLTSTAAGERADAYFAASMSLAGVVLGVGVLVATFVAGGSLELLENVARSLFGLDGSAGYPDWLKTVTGISTGLWMGMTALAIGAASVTVPDAVSAYLEQRKSGRRPSRRDPRLLDGVKS